MIEKDKHEAFRAKDLKAEAREKMLTLAEQTRLVVDANYYRIGLLHYLQTRSKLRPPSETLDVLNKCAECNCHRIIWSSADMYCTKNPSEHGCWCLGLHYEKRTIWAETVERN